VNAELHDLFPPLVAKVDHFCIVADTENPTGNVTGLSTEIVSKPTRVEVLQLLSEGLVLISARKIWIVRPETVYDFF